MTCLNLSEKSIHLWLAFPEEITQPDLLALYQTWLNAEEHKQWQRFHFDKHRHQYLITRALVRATLSRYADLPPEAWRFTRNGYGKPEIMQGQTALPLRFNLSHTDGLILCGVVLQHDLGVDVEYRERRNATLDIAKHYFSKTENAALQQLPADQQKNRFFDYWTLKEAYIKARGIGLSLPLQQFSFDLSCAKAPTVHFDAELNDNPVHWRFWQFQATPQHVAAVAVQAFSTKDFALVINKTVPAVTDSTLDLARLCAEP